jgi:hypothetical protein
MIDASKRWIACLLVTLALTAGPGCGGSAGSDAAGSARAAASVPVAAPAPAMPPELVDLLGVVPDDASNAFVLRIDQSAVSTDDWHKASRETETLVAFGLSVLPSLPFPDEIVIHVLTQSMYELIYGDADATPAFGAAWFVRFDEIMGLPRAVGAMAYTHPGTKAHGGCEADPPREARGFKVHNDEGALYNTVCVDARRAIGVGGEHTTDLLERLASKKTGASAAGKLLLSRGLPDDVWAAGAWTGKDERWPIVEAEIHVGREAADGSTAIRVRVRAVPGQRAAIERKLEGAAPALKPVAAAIAKKAETKIDGDAVEWTFRMTRDEAKRLYDEAPDQSPAALIKARGGRVTAP